MKREGIIHAELASRLAALRHTDTFVICDAGLPLARHTPCVDLGYRYGQATFMDVTATVLSEVVVEHSWVSRDVITVSPDVLQHLVGVGLGAHRPRALQGRCPGCGVRRPHRRGHVLRERVVPGRGAVLPVVAAANQTRTCYRNLSPEAGRLATVAPGGEERRT
jgi:hypothetical protein